MLEGIPVTVIILDGLALGLSLYLLSSGLAITFGMLGVVNFAHGSLFMWGAYIGYYVAAKTGSFALGLASSFASMALLGAVIKLSLMRNAHENPLTAAMITIGLMFLLDRLALIVWGEPTRMWSPSYLEGTVKLGGVIFYKYRLFLIIVGALLFAAVYAMVSRTYFGVVVRAGIHDKEMVEVLGINFERAATLMFMLGTGLAGLSGFLFVPWIGVNPSMGITFLLYAFAIVAIGGVESILGTLAASVAVGILQQFTMYYIPWITEAALFILMLALLLARPSGIAR